MGNDMFEIKPEWSKTRKYRIDIYQKYEYAGVDYYSAVIYEAKGNYLQQIESGVNYSNKALQEYRDESL